MLPCEDGRGARRAIASWPSLIDRAEGAILDCPLLTPCCKGGNLPRVLCPGVRGRPSSVSTLEAERGNEAAPVRANPLGDCHAGRGPAIPLAPPVPLSPLKPKPRAASSQ